MAERNDALVEAVARAMAKRNYPGASASDLDEMWEGFSLDAQAAIAAARPIIEREALGRAAKVADAQGYQCRRMAVGGRISDVFEAERQSAICGDIAAGIRALPQQSA